MKSIVYALGIIILINGITGCSHRAHIYNVENHPLPPEAQRMANQEIGQKISQVVYKRDWSCNQQTPNSLMCHIDKRNHQACVKIEYTQYHFSIHNMNTSHLGQKCGEIHPKYNKWIKIMEKDIVKAMSQENCL